jgi:hypothetical protein
MLQPGTPVAVLVKWPCKKEQQWLDAQISSVQRQSHSAGVRRMRAGLGLRM